MTHWLRFTADDRIGFGTLEGGTIHVHDGDMFATAAPTGERLALSSVQLLSPCTPAKIICLWNNFHALAAKLQVPEPTEPLYLLKAPSACLATGEPIRRPARYDGRIVFEGELGIVIGKRCSQCSEEHAADYIFGFTCINDITAADLITKDPTFPQWTRAKSFDTFGAIGPVIATGLDPATLTVRTLLNGTERQNYPISDMIVPPARLVSLLSHDMTLLPGDIIACGTSIGAGAMKAPTNIVDVVIAGIGTLSNTLTQ
ncbi:MAG: fumarylacetoacetate hydrolase family protein [Hyphomicrobiaceae bacterium]